MVSIPKIAFFGSPQIAVWVLEELEKGGLIPSIIITNPDSPQGRTLTLTPTPVAKWAESRGITVHKFETLKSPDVERVLRDSGCNLFIVAAYGKMIPENILDIPHHKTINVHPSLLPLLRGASPIRSSILENMNDTGVSIMILTKGMDEGPLLAQKAITIQREEWPLSGDVLDELLAKEGGKLLAETIPKWVTGGITPEEQEHSKATYSAKITKDMGELKLSDDPYKNLLKIRAFAGWPGTYFFHERGGKKIRIKIIDAHIENGALVITRIIPEGKNEMNYTDYMR